MKIKSTEHQTMTFLQNNRKPGKKSWKFDNYSHFFIATHYTAMHISGLFSTPWYRRLATRHVVTSRRFRELHYHTIHDQRSFCEFACDVNKSQVSTFYIFLSYRRRQWKKQWLKTVQRYGKYHHVYLIPLKQFCLECSVQSKVQKSSSVDHRCQNVSEKHIPSVDPTFSSWRI